MSNLLVRFRRINETSQERWNNPTQEDQMEYLLAFYGDEKALANIPPEREAATQQEWFKFYQALRKSARPPGPAQTPGSRLSLPAQTGRLPAGWSWGKRPARRKLAPIGRGPERRRPHPPR